MKECKDCRSKNSCSVETCPAGIDVAWEKILVEGEMKIASPKTKKTEA